MRTWTLASIFLAALTASAHQPVPDAAQLAWHEAEIGLFIHWAPNVYQNREYDARTIPRDKINPSKLDTDQWALAGKAFGAKYVVLVAKHVGGYCLWQTETTDYSIKTSPWKNGKGDVVADMAASCKKHDLLMGFYLSPRDDNFGARIGGVLSDPVRQKEYTDLYQKQLIELLTKYGPMFEIWFDGRIHIPVAEVLAKYSPGSPTFQGPQSPVRWVGNEHGVAHYPTWSRVPTKYPLVTPGRPDGEVWNPAEVDVSLRRPNWFWNTSNANRLLSLDQLIEIYYKSVGRGTNLLLNITPDREGVVPEADMKRLEEFGAEIRRRFGKPIASTHGTGNELVLSLPSETSIDHIQLREDLRHGQRVNAFTLEGRSQTGWTSLFTGSAIGNRLILPLAPVGVDAVRLRVTGSDETPMIRELSVFHTGAKMPLSLFLAGSRQPLDEAPVISRGRDGMIYINLPSPDIETFYTTDGAEATASSTPYHEPWSCPSGTVRARFYRSEATTEISPEAIRRFGLPADQIKLVRVSSAERGYGGARACDSEPGSIWHTAWKPSIVPGPHEIVFDLGEEKSVKAFSWMPRQDMSANQPESITLHVADTPDGEGQTFHADCAAGFRSAPRAEQWFDLPRPLKGRYVRLVVPRNIAGRGDLAAAEIQIDAE